MMKCDELQQRLDDYLDGDLDTILVSMLEQHITSCDSCKTKVSQSKFIQSELKQVLNCQSTADSAPSEAFISSAFEKVRTRYPETQSNHFWSGNRVTLRTGFITAIAAGFSFWVILATFILPGMDSSILPSTVASNTHVIESESLVSTLNLKIDETKVLRIAIDTQDDFDKVTFSVILPKHVELKGHANKHELSWNSKLVKGNNILRIPLKAIQYGQGEFIARMTHNGKVKTFKLFLKSDKPDLSHIQGLESQV